MKTLKNFALGVATMFVAGSMALAQQTPPKYVNSNPGIFVGGTASQKVTQLPQKAQKFLADNFKYKEIRKCKKDYPKGNYEVELRDGTDIEFTPAGEWQEIDAADNTTLAEALLKNILHKKAYKELVERGYINMVESVERTADGGYKVDVDKVVYDEILFDINGTLIAVYDD
ncbi:MAG: PepSY-like domain-containing protein [Muribaculum sp.]|nr:PepSY-like domain-containing protein [Muribaculaceae bacterium]MCM1080791.1 PepSY-like domain-containing protein [Muribaculum sp.]